MIKLLMLMMTCVCLSDLSYALSSLQAAAWSRNPERLQKVLSMNDYTKKQLTEALTAVVDDGSLDMVKTLVEAGAEVKGSRILLVLAERSIQSLEEYEEIPKIADYLIEHGAELDPQTKIGSNGFGGGTPLYYACKRNGKLALTLLRHGSNPELILKPKGDFVLRQAIRFKIPELPIELLKKGVPPERAGDESTPLHKAASLGMIDVARALLDYGADVNRADKRMGRTPLFSAVFAPTNSIDVYDFLVSKGADVRARDKGGMGILEYIKKERKALRNKRHLYSDKFFENYENNFRQLFQHQKEYLKFADKGESPVKLAKRFLTDSQANRKVVSVSSETTKRADKNKKEPKIFSTKKQTTHTKRIAQQNNNREKVVISLVAIFVIVAGSGIFYFRKTIPK